MENQAELLRQLAQPFPPEMMTWKPGATKGDKCMALAYGDFRAYMKRLDELFGFEWSVRYQPWQQERIICELTILGVTRSSTGEYDKQDEQSNIEGSVAEAMAFKRACAMFGLGRYLYDLPSTWVEFDPATKKITTQGQAKLMATYNIYYSKAMAQKAPQPTQASKVEREGTNGRDNPFNDTELLKMLDHLNALGEELYAERWPQVRGYNVERVSGGATTSSDKLTTEQLQKLIAGMEKLKSKQSEANIEMVTA